MTVQGWLMESDRIIVRAAAIAVGLEELKELTAHFKGEQQQLFRAAKMEFASQLAVGLTSKRYGGSCEHEEAALELLQQIGEGDEAHQQLEVNAELPLSRPHTILRSVAMHADGHHQSKGARSPRRRA